jgi:hypothetical protein
LTHSTHSIERHSADYPWHERIPTAEKILAVEGGATYAVDDAEGAWWLIGDEAATGDLLPDEDESLSGILVKIERFSDREEWVQARAAQAGLRLNVRTSGSVLPAYLDAMAELIPRRSEELGLTGINERDHLQPWSVEILEDLSPTDRSRFHRIRFDTGNKPTFPEHWPRVGAIDISIREESAPPVALELKAGASHEALGHCGWDLLKLALTLRMGECSSGYLVAATKVQWFDEGRLGTEVFADATWTAIDVRDRCSAWFIDYEKRNDPPLKKIPMRGTVEAYDGRDFEIAGVPWRLAISEVKVEPTGWYDWEEFGFRPIPDAKSLGRTQSRAEETHEP